MNPAPGRIVLNALCCGVGLALLALAPPRAEGSTVGLRFETGAQRVSPSATFEVSIVADISDPLLGFGLELAFDERYLDLNSLIVGSLFAAAPNGAGNVLGGLAFPLPVSGEGVELGVANFTARQAGTSFLDISITEGDLTEGFATADIGAFAEFEVDAQAITVVPISDDPGGGSPVPEPATFVFLALGGLSMVGQLKWGRYLWVEDRDDDKRGKR